MARGLDKLDAVISLVRQEVGSDFAVSQFHILVDIAREPGITQFRLGEQIGMLTGTVSKNVKILSQYLEEFHGTRTLRGYGLVEQRPDLLERRRMALFLTKKGDTLMKTVEKIIEGGDR